MLSQAENVMDYVPFCCWFAIVPIILAVSVPGAVATTAAAAANNQFLVYRVHQIDFAHSAYGSRSSVFSLEAVTPGHITDSFARKCALFKLADLLQGNNFDVYDVFLNKVLSQSLVSAVLIIYEDLKASFTEEEINSLQAIERKLLTNETSLPIYLVEENEEINRLYEEYSQVKETQTASLYDLVVKNVFFDSHQFVITGPQTSSINNAVITSLQAKLIGAGPEDQLPTYAIVAHYDSYSVVPGLSFGADSNASGLVILLELMRLFSKLYSSTKTRPKANLVFLVSGGGKINYFGTQRWLDENLEASHAPMTPLFENMQFALCLDSLADSLGSNGLFMYVSKPPKPNTPSATFWSNLNDVSTRYYPTINSSMIHKKINLADDFLSFEHERFSLRRVSAFTLSSLASPKAMKRQTLVDVYREGYIRALEINANIIGEALARQLFGPMDEVLFKSEFAVSSSHLKSLFEHVTNIPRAQQMLLTTSKGTSHQLPPLLKTIHAIMRKYSSNQIKQLHSKFDTKNPEFVFYEPVSAKMDVYNMKPAVFDFIITISILLYLGVFYFIIRNFHYFSFASRSGSQENGKVKAR